MSAAAMLAVVSCNKAEIEGPKTESPSVEISGDAFEFVAYTESATKTALNGLETIWLPGDEIDINEVPYITNKGGMPAFFTKIDEDKEAPYAPYMAGYPCYDVYNNYADTDGTLCFNFSHDFILYAGKIHDEVLAVAYSESEPKLEFKNVVSMLKFRVPQFGEDVTEIRISANEPLAGYIHVDYNNGVPTWEIDEGGANEGEQDSYNELTLEPYNNKFTVGDSTDETYYYVPILPGKKTNLTVKINGYIAATGKELECKRNVIHNLGTLPAPKPYDWGLVGQHQGWDITNPTPMYQVADNAYAKLNIKLESNGFKFAKTGLQNWDTANTHFGAWKESEGGYFNYSTEMEAGAWYEVYTNNLDEQGTNIGVGDFSKKYDVYVKIMQDADWGQKLGYTVIPAGTAVSF